MTPLVRKGVALAVVQVALVASLGAKLLIDRAGLPRVWLRATAYSPDTPLRGRYLELRVEVAVGPGLLFPATKPITQPDNRTVLQPTTPQAVTLAVQNNTLVALPANRSDIRADEFLRDNGERVGVLHEPVAFFIPEHAADPSVRQPAEELWVEVSVPRHGPPRPIQLGVKKNGVLTPIDLK